MKSRNRQFKELYYKKLGSIFDFYAETDDSIKARLKLGNLEMSIKKFEPVTPREKDLAIGYLELLKRRFF